MDYDFSRLSTRSFEHLIQALAVKLLGPSVSIFGDGPDGGREASFERLGNFPGSEDPWNDYGIIQAKFRQKTTTPGADGRWVALELEKELKKFTSNRKLRVPRYYLLATNVSLTAVAEKGGKDKVAAVFERYRSRIGLRDYHVWDYDQLRSYLDDASEIRHAYGAWITPGDALASLIKRLESCGLDFASTITNYLQKEVHSDELVRLGQAGASEKDSTPLASVFTDLPIGSSTEQDDYDNCRSDLFAVRQLIEIGNERLARSATSRLVKSEAAGHQERMGRVVFLGGPGQGKTTLSQFICQLHRAQLLRELCPGSLLPDTERAIRSIQSQAAVEGIPPPALPRFPVRIVLNNFASELAGGHVASLLEFLSEKIRLRTQRRIDVETLRGWLSHYPWLLVLDGLDEVPGASNRTDVLNAVQDLLVDINDLDADVLLIATTRPQGYNEEFSPQNFIHEELAPLTVEQALKYANRLVRQRWAADSEKALVLMDRLERASAEESTARLMRSPLQVTIMALLVESLGLPPRERWRLFKEYFQVIVRREKERSIPSAALLNAFEPDINYIHKAVGYELQRISERSGHTDATLSESDFVSLVRCRLDSEGHAGVARDELASEITTAALERLVFLVSPRQGQIGFEIRSLQEFMAAEYITDGADQEVIIRIQAIATASHWRNVFLFAAGKCFYERQHLRHHLHSMLCVLNEPGEKARMLDGLLLTGSQLALDILEDGSLLRQPEQRRLYTRLAMRLIELPPSDDLHRLAAQYTHDLRDVFEDSLEAASASSRLTGFLGAWRVLLHLVDEHEWARSIVSRNWPSEEKDIEAVFCSADRIRNEFVLQRWIAFAKSRPPSYVAKLLDKAHDQVISPAGAPHWMRKLLTGEEGSIDVTVALKQVGRSFEFSYVPVANMAEHDQDLMLEGIPADPEMHPAWLWLMRAVRFRDAPSVNALADLVRTYKQMRDLGHQPNLSVGSQNMAWPLAAVIGVIQDGSADADWIASEIERGALGTPENWFEAQKRWQEKGLVPDDLGRFMSGSLPFDDCIQNVGFPLSQGGAVASHGDDLVTSLIELTKIWSGLKGLDAKRLLADQLLFVASVVARIGKEMPREFWSQLDDVLRNSKRPWLEIDILANMPNEFWQIDQSEEVVRLFGARRLICHRKSSVVPSFVRIEELALRMPTEKGVLNCLAAACISGYRPKLCRYAERLVAADFEGDIARHYVIVSLASEPPTGSSWEAIMRYVDGYVESEAFVEELCSVASLRILPDHAIVELMSGAYRRIPARDVNLRKQVMRVLRDVQKSRMSDLEQ